MRYNRFLGNLLFVSVAALCAGTLGAADTYQVDPVHSMALFRVKHLGVSFVHGRINAPSGTITLDEADPSKCAVELEVKAEGIDTSNEKRDTHLKSPDFFNAKQFPLIIFKSKSVKRAGETTYEVTGDLSLLGVSKELTVKVARIGSGKDPKGGARTGFETSFTIKRSDFGMKFMLDGVSDEVQITVSTEAVKAEAGK